MYKFILSIVLINLVFCKTSQNGKFDEALRESFAPTKENVSDKLIVVEPKNQNLKWKDKTKQKLLVVTLKYGNEISPTKVLQSEVWVTTAPELKDFCSKLNLSEDDLKYRLNQYLGLRPNDVKNYAISFWVSPKDLFRPCPDPEITDSKCELDFPAKVSEDHKKWFLEKVASNKEYPWSKLGYTMDWGRERPFIGASEFIVRKETLVEVESVKTIKEYCAE